MELSHYRDQEWYKQKLTFSFEKELSPSLLFSLCIDMLMEI